MAKRKRTPPKSSLYGQPLSGNEIRLLKLVQPEGEYGGHGRILHGRTNTTRENIGYGLLNCSLFSVPFTLKSAEVKDSNPGVPEFDALSYVWMQGFGRASCIHCNGLSVTITQSLHDALYQIWSDDKNASVWADALCINQNDPLEKADQVARMGNIFKGAQRVHIWLGAEERGNSEAWDFIQWATKNAYRGSRTTLKELRSRAEKIKKGFDDIHDRSWFYRAWTMQEAALARSTIFRCGSLKMEGQPFVRFVQWLSNMEPGDEEEQGRGELWSLKNSASWLLPRMPQPQSILSLSSALLALWNREATDDRDKVYGVLGLLDHCPLVPDYTASTRKVYIRAACACIAEDKSLDILTLLEGATLDSFIPSWTPDWRARGASTRRFLERQPLRGIFESETKPFTLPHLNRNFDIGILAATGVAIGTLEAGVSDSSPPVISNFPAYALSSYHSAEGMLKWYLGRTANPKDLPIRRDFIQTVEGHGEQLFPRMLDKPSKESLEGRYPVPKANPRFRRGDWVAMLDGGSVPFVLRPEQPLGSKATAFRLIGNLGWFIYDVPSHNKRAQHVIAHGRLKVGERLRLVARDGRLRYESSRSPSARENGDEEHRLFGCNTLTREIDFWASFDCVVGTFHLI